MKTPPSQAEYTKAANAILKVLDVFVAARVPEMLQDRVSSEMPAVAGAAAKAALDDLYGMTGTLPDRAAVDWGKHFVVEGTS
jgi:hypothetical protein